MTTFDLPSLRLSAGSHTIKVKAKATHLLTSEFSNAVTYDVYVQLNAPVLSLSGDIVSWVAIPNASSYTLYVDGSSYQTLISTTSADLSSLSLGEHSIQVRAIGSGYYTDSELSTAITYTKYQQLSAPVISLNVSTLSWSAISNASSYTLYVDGDVAQTGITSLTFDLSTLTSLSPTAHTVQLKAIGSGYYTDSNFSNSVSYSPMSQLATPQNVSVSGTSATFDEVQNATSYEFIADGTTSIGTYTVPSGYNVVITVGSDAAQSDVTVYDGVDTSSTPLLVIPSGSNHTVSIASGHMTLYENGPNIYNNGAVSGGVTFDSSSRDGDDHTFYYTVSGDGTVGAPYVGCFAKGTKILLANGGTKNIEDITYDDELIVWDFHKGKLATAKPVWILDGGKCSFYYKVILSDGTEMKLCGPVGHRLFNITKQQMLYCVDCVGDEVYKADGSIVTVLSCEKVQETVNYYNLTTEKYLDCFAEGVLTGSRLNNMYHISDMKYDSDKRLISEEEEKERWAVRGMEVPK